MNWDISRFPISTCEIGTTDHLGTCAIRSPPKDGTRNNVLNWDISRFPIYQFWTHIIHFAISLDNLDKEQFGPKNWSDYERKFKNHHISTKGSSRESQYILKIY
jgi:hypothetical protein